MTVTAYARYRGNENLPDVGAVHPTLKAIVDGLVVSGVLEEDDADSIETIIHRPPVVERGKPYAVVVTVSPVASDDGTTFPVTSLDIGVCNG